MRAGAIDIGTNSARLLVVDGSADLIRTSVVTGLGRGIAITGRLNPQGRAATLETLATFRRWLSEFGDPPCRAVMTAVGRDASDTDDFVVEAAAVLGRAPEVISGDEEARLAFRGATTDREPGDWVVIDIGGGSTEIVSARGGVSRDIGSVRITDLVLGEGPVGARRLAEARTWGRRVLGDNHPAGSLIGVAGTWTSLAALDRGSSEGVAGHVLTRAGIGDLIMELAEMTTAEIRELPALDPARAPVILGGAVVADLTLEVLEATQAVISVRDTLDGIVDDLVGSADR